MQSPITLNQYRAARARHLRAVRGFRKEMRAVEGTFAALSWLDPILDAQRAMVALRRRFQIGRAQR